MAAGARVRVQRLDVQQCGRGGPYCHHGVDGAGRVQDGPLGSCMRCEGRALACAQVDAGEGGRGGGGGRPWQSRRPSRRLIWVELHPVHLCCERWARGCSRVACDRSRLPFDRKDGRRSCQGEPTGRSGLVGEPALPMGRVRDGGGGGGGALGGAQVPEEERVPLGRLVLRQGGGWGAPGGPEVGQGERVRVGRGHDAKRGDLWAAGGAQVGEEAEGRLPLGRRRCRQLRCSGWARLHSSVGHRGGRVRLHGLHPLLESRPRRAAGGAPIPEGAARVPLGSADDALCSNEGPRGLLRVGRQPGLRL
mmetsp:Transcript_7066/g.18224  ORF Transcript_7066/g.18224 Transcript_7066/m.18224 type:complete len:306 (-) Transcript_7066:40-957(-)